MLFNSWEFLVLLAITFSVYYGPWSSGRHGKEWQVVIALTASLVFYGWEDARLIGILAISCVGNSIATARIIRHKVSGEEEWVRVWTRRAVIMNLALLAFFKYLPFLAGMMPFLPGKWITWAKAIPLPIGISFYTFHGISMIVDVSRGQVTREGDTIVSGNRGVAFLRGVRDIGFYLLFFPQLVAGPIVKAKEFWPQIKSKHFAEIDWLTVRRALILGYFLKIFVADNLSEQTRTLTQGTDFLLSSRPGDLVPLLYCYSLQIFADFAGYSLIAIGLAALFGYRFPINFNFPYLSQTITEFWRRWHMSLSSWLRDYLYIPLGGNRKGELCTFRNLFLVMFLGGLWHGAEWKFALWGSLHGVFLAMERLLSRGTEKKTATNSSALVGCCKAVLRVAFTFHVVTILWLAFLMPDMASIASFFKGVFSSKPGFSGPPVFSLLFYGTVVVVYHLWGWLKEHAARVSNSLLHSSFEPILHGVMLFLIITNPGAPSGFIYFQF